VLHRDAADRNRRAADFSEASDDRRDLLLEPLFVAALLVVEFQELEQRHVRLPGGERGVGERASPDIGGRGRCRAACFEFG
jgi:hypothetical protein